MKALIKGYEVVLLFISVILLSIPEPRKKGTLIRCWFNGIYYLNNYEIMDDLFKKYGGKNYQEVDENDLPENSFLDKHKNKAAAVAFIILVFLGFLMFSGNDDTLETTPKEYSSQEYDIRSKEILEKLIYEKMDNRPLIIHGGLFRGLDVEKYETNEQYRESVNKNLVTYAE